MEALHLTGKRFGRLKVLKFAGNDSDLRRRRLWLCLCDCGNMVTVRACNLRSGNTSSCGCFQRQKTSMANLKHGATINRQATRLYTIWSSMIQRCQDNSCTNYRNYGGRGITVCDEWRNDYLTFYNWAMANGYRNDLTIDRIDNDGNYEPSNCRWATAKEQARNKRNVAMITHEGVSRTLPEWADSGGISLATLRQRLKAGWSLHEALEKPVRHRPHRLMVTFRGQTRTLSEWANKLGLPRKLLSLRLHRGWSVERALTAPKGGEDNALAKTQLA